MSVLPSVHVYELGCHWEIIVKFCIMGFHQFVEEFEMWIKFDMIFGNFIVSCVIHKVIICRIFYSLKS